MIFAAVCGLPIGLILLLKLDTCYFPVLFFAIKFAAARIMDFDRVRNSVMFQLLVITVLLVVIIIRNNGKLKIRRKFYEKQYRQNIEDDHSGWMDDFDCRYARDHSESCRKC